jgi:hypothetical protein
MLRRFGRLEADDVVPREPLMTDRLTVESSSEGPPPGGREHAAAKTPRVRRSKASCRLPDDGSALFLGWKGTAHQPQLGFRPTASAHDPREPLTYSGDGHLLTIAPTGAGKGVGAIIPALLTYPGSIIVTDIKGENYQVTARYRREIGQQVVVLDPFSLVTPKDKTDKLNPFDLFTIPGSDVESDAEMLAAQLAVGHEFSTDRYWEDTGRGLVSGLLADVATSSPPEKRNLCTLRELLYNDDLDYTMAVALDTRKKTMSPLARDEFIAYLAAPSDKTRPCIRTTATRQHQRFSLLGTLDIFAQRSPQQQTDDDLLGAAAREIAQPPSVVALVGGHPHDRGDAAHAAAATPHPVFTR